MAEVFGIPIIGGGVAKTSGKLAFAASLLAELLDNDSDGCADDPNALAYLLKKDPASMGFPATKNAIFMTTDEEAPDMMSALELGYASKQAIGLTECFPKFAGLKSGSFVGKNSNFDATQEEFLHFINGEGHAKAYPKIFGTLWTSNSLLTNAMDSARGKKLKTTPATKAGYPTGAWYTYSDTSCTYGCQAIEYLWWGYVAYTGIGNAVATLPDFKNEFSPLTQKAFKAKDVKLAKLFQDSEKKTAAYRLAIKPADGTYTGCKTCKGGINHGGN